jgi:hypothetical protein
MWLSKWLLFNDKLSIPNQSNTNIEVNGLHPTRVAQWVQLGSWIT